MGKVSRKKVMLNMHEEFTQKYPDKRLKSNKIYAQNIFKMK
jgi:hypothetical protein